MSKPNLEGRSSTPDVSITNVDFAFDPELRKKEQERLQEQEKLQAQRDWEDYLQTRDYLDDSGNIHDAKTGRFKKDDRDADGNRAYYNDVYEATLSDTSRENMGILSLARLARDARLHGDKTMLLDLEDEIMSKLSEMQEKYNWSEESANFHLDKILSIIHEGEAEEQSPDGQSPDDTPAPDPSTQEKQVSPVSKTPNIDELLRKLRERNKELESSDPTSKRIERSRDGIFDKVKKGLGRAALFMSIVGTAVAFAASSLLSSANNSEANDNIPSPTQPSATSEAAFSSATAGLVVGEIGSEKPGSAEEEEAYGYDRELDPYFAEDKASEWNMSNGFSTDGTTEKAMTEWGDDWENSPQMMAMIASELGIDGSGDPVALAELLTKNPNAYEDMINRIEKALNKATSVRFEQYLAGTPYDSWYTTLDQNGNPQLVQSFDVVRSEDVTLMVFEVDGKTYKVISECGQLIVEEPNVNVPRFEIPQTPPPTPDTPPVTPPVTPEIPDTEPEPKQPEKDINVNPQLPEQTQMGDTRMASGEETLAATPPESYTPPQTTESESIAPGAQENDRTDSDNSTPETIPEAPAGANGTNGVNTGIIE